MRPACVRSPDDLSPAPPGGRGWPPSCSLCPPPPTPRPHGDGHRRRRRAAQRAQRRPRGQGGRRLGRARDRRRADLRAVAGDRARHRRHQGARRLRLGRSEQPRLQLVARRPRGAPRQRRRACARCWSSPAPGRCGRRRSPVATASATSRAPTSSAQFARAAALRYAAAVDRWILWNEPNLPLWLQPQNTCKGKRCTPYAPHLYRRLVRAAYPAIKTVDPTSTVLFGALAPNGENATKQNARTRPLAFIRSMGCVKTTLKRDRSGPCAGFKPLTGDGFAYHPHATKLAPERAAGDPRQRLDRRPAAPRAHARRHPARRRAQEGRRRQVRPVLHRVGLPDASARQDPRRVAGQAVALAAAGRVHRLQDPRVKLLTQYEWRDEPRPARHAATPTRAGSRDCATVTDKAKPSLAGFANPFFVDQRPGSRSVRLWGQVRPGNAHSITVQRRKAGSKRWTRVKDALDQRRRLLEAQPDGQRDDRLPLPAGSRPMPTTRRSARSRRARSSARRSASAAARRG